MSDVYLKNGKPLQEDGYILTDLLKGMSRKELIEEILGTHSHDWLVENGFIKKTEHEILSMYSNPLRTPLSFQSL